MERGANGAKRDRRVGVTLPTIRPELSELRSNIRFMRNRARMAFVVSVILTAVAGVGITLPAVAHADGRIVTTVTRVSDGDTITVADPFFGRERIRILGIDSPGDIPRRG